MAFHAHHSGVEQHLGAPEALVADGDHLPVGKLVALLQLGGAHGELHLLLKVKGNVRQLLLDVTHNFALGGGGERVAALGQDLHQVVRQVATRKVETQDGVGKSVTLVDGHSVRDTVAGIEHNTGGTARGVQRKHSLNGDVHGGDVEGLEHDLGHLLAVSLRVEGGLGEQHGVLLGGHAQLVVESVMPDLLHVVPVGHNTVLNRVLQGKDTTLGLRLVTDVGVLLTHTDHHALVARTAHDRGENRAGSIVTGEPGLHHAGSVVAHQGGNLTLISHVC
mmetsp:Transcript_34935/g.76379  ORF Transcript_34935/g.76379 Transcript_34935/m.76379 type:complete len:277 (-) Transcript_34935:67-897(-)